MIDTSLLPKPGAALARAFPLVFEAFETILHDVGAMNAHEPRTTREMFLAASREITSPGGTMARMRTAEDEAKRLTPEQLQTVAAGDRDESVEICTELGIKVLSPLLQDLFNAL